jgi:hypothetical protein
MTNRHRRGHWFGVRISALWATLGLVLGCGRSVLLDDGTSAGSSGDGMNAATSGTGSAGPDATDDLDAGTESTLDGDSLVRGPDAASLARGLDASSSAAPDAAAPPPGPCSVFTCLGGCCLPDGTCFRATLSSDGTFPTDIPCGGTGEACITCPAGDSCIAEACEHDVAPTCSPSTCGGCCEGPGASDQCWEGTDDNFCGSGGNTCQRCTPDSNGGHCVADSTGGGHCEDVGLCNATNCAGCCLGNVCAEGSQNVACGERGVACQDCTPDAGTCLGVVMNDGGVRELCGYDCLELNEIECQTYCSSPSDCVPVTQLFGGGP